MDGWGIRGLMRGVGIQLFHLLNVYSPKSFKKAMIREKKLSTLQQQGDIKCKSSDSFENNSVNKDSQPSKSPKYRSCKKKKIISLQCPTIKCYILKNTSDK